MFLFLLISVMSTRIKKNQEWTRGREITLIEFLKQNQNFLQPTITKELKIQKRNLYSILMEQLENVFNGMYCPVWLIKNYNNY